MSGTILLIDDEPKLRQLLARILSLEDYRVLEADDTGDAPAWCIFPTFEGMALEEIVLTLLRGMVG